MIYLSGKSENGQADSDNTSDDGGQGLEKWVEVLPAQIGAQVVNEAVNLAQSEHSQALKKINCETILRTRIIT